MYQSTKHTYIHKPHIQSVVQRYFEITKKSYTFNTKVHSEIPWNTIMPRLLHCHAHSYYQKGGEIKRKNKTLTHKINYCNNRDDKHGSFPVARENCHESRVNKWQFSVCLSLSTHATLPAPWWSYLAQDIRVTMRVLWYNRTAAPIQLEENHLNYVSMGKQTNTNKSQPFSP